MGIAGGSNGSIAHDRRAMTRFVGSDHGADRADLVWAPYWPLRVLHFPLRSYEQYRRRVETVLFQGDPPMTETRKRLRRRYKNGRLEDSYLAMITPDAELQDEIDRGRARRPTPRCAMRSPPCPGRSRH